jgi:hypothetical protein
MDFIASCLYHLKMQPKIFLLGKWLFGGPRGGARAKVTPGQYGALRQNVPAQPSAIRSQLRHYSSWTMPEFRSLFRADCLIRSYEK